MIDNYLPGSNCTSEIEYFSSWTIEGSPVLSRDLFSFDQFDVPTNPTVTNGELSHYYATKSFGAKNTSLTTSVKSVLHQTTSA